MHWNIDSFNQWGFELGRVVALIEDLRFGLGLEETGVGLTSANVGRFELECLEVASSTLNVGAYLSSIQCSRERSALSCLIRTVNLSEEGIAELFQTKPNLKEKRDCDCLIQQVEQLEVIASFVPERKVIALPAVEAAGRFKLRSLLEILKDYFETRSALSSETPHTWPHSQTKIEAAVDTPAAVRAAVRVFVAVGLAATFWVATAWPAGDTFLVWAGLASCRDAIAPDPARATQAAFRGMVIATVPAYLITFYLLPQMDGFTMFVLAVLPFIVLGAGIAASLDRLGEFGNAMLLLGNSMDPINEMQYDVVAFFNNVLATIMGVGVACLTQAVILPIDINQRRLAAERRLIQRIARAIQQTGTTRIAYLASVVRTLNDFLSLPGNAEGTQDNRADELINLWALGYEVVSLNRRGVPLDLVDCRSKLVSSIAEFLKQPSERRLAAVESSSGEGYQSSLQALVQVAPDSPPDDRFISWAAGFSVICHRVHVQEHLSNVSSKLQPLTK